MVSLELSLQLGTTIYFFLVRLLEILQTLGVWQICYKVVIALLQIPYNTGMAGLLSSCAASMISTGSTTPVVDSTNQEDNGCSVIAF